jgi:ATP-dependent DNA helicase RecG
MDLNQIKEIIKQGESNTVEFKKSTGMLRAAFATVCAFLNGEGGVVFIGITDKGKIVGQEVSDKTRQEIANAVSEIEPPAQSHISVSYVPVDDKKRIIVIKVKAGDYIPYARDGKPFHRIESTSSKMPQHRYEQLIVKREQMNHSWEDIIASKKYTINSLDHQEIRKTIEQGVRFNRIPSEALQDSIEETMIRLGLLEDGKINNAAIALFGNDLFPTYSQCLIKLGRFRGVDRSSDFIDNQQIYGNAFKQLSEASNFLMRHLPIASFFQEGQFERIDKPALPVLAVREALINAICHRSYSDSSGHITVSIFDDRLEIWNYGTLLSPLKISDLKHKHHSYLRNKLISQAFYNRGLIEKWATGIGKMLLFCKEANLPEPKFEEYSGGFEVTFKFAESISTSIIKNQFKIELSSRQQEILAIIKKYHTANIQQIIQNLKSAPSRTMIKRDLDYMKKNGFIVLKGSARNAVWALS